MMGLFTKSPATTFLPRPTARTPLLEPLAPVRATPAQRRTTHMAASLLLDYPDAGTLAAAREVRDVVGQLPDAVQARLGTFLDDLETGEPAALEARYVATFDLKRKCSMYLSYYAAGDTRKRGMALVRFVQAYRAAGWEVDGEELPDYLPMALEFSARARTRDEERIAAGLLGSHRQGIEVLRSALAAMASPYALVVEAVCLTLPPLDAETERRYLELVTSGPPTEMVGLSAMGPLEPFAPAGAPPEEVRR